MKEIPFVKYSSNGNNFVIVDETRTEILTEVEKAQFAFQATNTCFGIGSDNLLIIQRCTPDTLASINRRHRYWSHLPDPGSADYIFRMFEPSGEEALCCGNGLMCIASYLYRTYQETAVKILTEIPFSEPRIVSIGTNAQDRSSWTNMGYPRRLPSELVVGLNLHPLDAQISFLDGIKINFRAHDLAPFSSKTSLELSGYLVFTGEPHFIAIAPDDLSEPAVARMIFAESNPVVSETGQIEKRVNFGTQLMHQIGTYLNRHYRENFPAGLNVNFARTDTFSHALEYRCFERGINRETLSCGTGALAVAYVIKHLYGLASRKIYVRPYLCRRHQPDAQILVEETPAGWLLNGTPLYLFDGIFRLTSSSHQPSKALKSNTHKDNQTEMPPSRSNILNPIEASN